MLLKSGSEVVPASGADVRDVPSRGSVEAARFFVDVATPSPSLEAVLSTQGRKVDSEHDGINAVQDGFPSKLQHANTCNVKSLAIHEYASPLGNVVPLSFGKPETK